MAFLNPLYLWAFLGLAVPVAIHLWSKKEGRTIKVGSIQFLKDSDPKKASSIKLNEIWLLILRMLALTLLIFIIAGPVLKGKGSRSSMIYLVETSLLQQEKIKRMMDTIEPDIQVKLLAPGFPEYSPDDEVIPENIPDYWLLTRQMNKLNSDSIVVFTSAYSQGLKGKRPLTDQNIKWIQIIPDESVEEPIAAIQKGNEYEIVSVRGDHSGLQINKVVFSGDKGDLNTNEAEDSIIITHNGKQSYLPLRIADTLKVTLFNDEGMEGQMMYISSSLRAISNYLSTPTKFTILDKEDSVTHEKDLLIWLSTSPGKETVSPVLIWKPDSLANTLVAEGKSKNIFHLTQKLNSENIVEEHFPEQLLLILGVNEKLKKEIASYDRRVLPLEEIRPISGTIGGKTEVNNSRDISKYIWLLLLPILILERGLSVYRKQ